jgi:hypothetical protein
MSEDTELLHLLSFLWVTISTILLTLPVGFSVSLKCCILYINFQSPVFLLFLFACRYWYLFLIFSGKYSFKIGLGELGVKMWTVFSCFRVWYNRQAVVNRGGGGKKSKEHFQKICVCHSTLTEILFLPNFAQNSVLCPRMCLRHCFFTGIFLLFGIFWLQLNMFQTIKYLLGIGVVTFLCGNKLLAKIASDRKQH